MLRKIFGILAFLLVPTSVLSQAYTTITATNVTVDNGSGTAINPPSSSQLCFNGVNSSGATITYTPSGGSPTTGPVCGTLNGTGGLTGSLQVANPATAAPLGLLYTITVVNGATTYLTIPTVSLSGTVWSFDSFALGGTASANGIGKAHLACAAGAQWSSTTLPPGQNNQRCNTSGLWDSYPPANYCPAGMAYLIPQQGGTPICQAPTLEGNGAPSGSCFEKSTYLDVTGGGFYACTNGVWSLKSSSSPGVTSIQGAAGSFSFNGAGFGGCSSSGGTTTCTFTGGGSALPSTHQILAGNGTGGAVATALDDGQTTPGVVTSTETIQAVMSSALSEPFYGINNAASSTVIGAAAFTCPNISTGTAAGCSLEVGKNNTAGVDAARATLQYRYGGSTAANRGALSMSTSGADPVALLWDFSGNVYLPKLLNQGCIGTDTDGKFIPGTGCAGFSLTTTGTSGPATYSAGVLNVPQYQGVLSLTTTGSSGPATLIGTTLNIPQYAGGTLTNALTMNNSGSGATSGSTFDGSAAKTISYNTIGAQQALTLTTTGTSGPATLSGGALNIPQYSSSSGVTQLNGLSGSLSLAGAGGISITPSGSTITISNTSNVVVDPTQSPYNASQLTVVSCNLTNGSNVITCNSAASWISNQGGIWIPPVSVGTSSNIPATGTLCDHVTVSGTTLTMLTSGGAACNANFTSVNYSTPAFHTYTVKGYGNSGGNSLTLTATDSTFKNGMGIRVVGAGTAGADLVCAKITISGTAVTLLQSDGVTACNIATTISSGTPAQVWHDDTYAFQQAVAQNANVHTPRGSYYLSGEVDLSTPMIFDGDGKQETVLIPVKDAINPLVIKTSGVTVQNLGFETVETFTPTSGSQLSLCDGSSICQSTTISGNYFYGGFWSFQVLGHSIQGLFSGNYGQNAYGGAIYVNNPTPYGDINYVNNQFTSCNTVSCNTTAYGIKIDAADTQTFQFNKINEFAHGIYLTGATGVVEQQRFVGNSCETGGNYSVNYHCFDVEKTGSSNVLNISWLNGEIAMFNGGLIAYIGPYVTGVTVSSAQLIGNSASNCINVSSSNTVFSGNIITGCNDAIELTPAAINTSIVGNTIHDNSGYGVSVPIGSGNVTISSNAFQLNTSGSINAYQPVIAGLNTGNDLTFNAPVVAQMYDTLVGANTTNMTAHTANTGQTWTNLGSWISSTGNVLLNGSNAALASGTGTFGVYSSLTPATADYTSSIRAQRISGTTAIWVTGRTDNAAQNTYACSYNGNTSVFLLKYVGGVQSTLSTGTVTQWATNVSHTLSLKMVGNSLACQQDGVNTNTATDSGVTAAGTAGFLVGGSNNAAVTLVSVN